MKRILLFLLLCSGALAQKHPTAIGSGGSGSVTNDTTTNAAMCMIWVTASGSVPLYSSCSDITYNPSTKTFTVAGSIGSGTAPTACGSATGCLGATAASTASTQTAGQGSVRLDTSYWKVRNTNGTAEFTLGSNYSATGTGAIGALDATNGVSQTIICTATCSLTPLTPPAAGYQLCVVMAAGVTGTITLNALGNSAMYGKTDGSAYGTAGTGTAVSGSATGNRICIVGRDATHYETTGSSGTFTMN